MRFSPVLPGLRQACGLWRLRHRGSGENRWRAVWPGKAGEGGVRFGTPDKFLPGGKHGGIFPSGCLSRPTVSGKQRPGEDAVRTAHPFPCQRRAGHPGEQARYGPVSRGSPAVSVGKNARDTPRNPPAGGRLLAREKSRATRLALIRGRSCQKPGRRGDTAPDGFIPFSCAGRVKEAMNRNWRKRQTALPVRQAGLPDRRVLFQVLDALMQGSRVSAGGWTVLEAP